jgi:hypothetical protein
VGSFLCLRDSATGPAGVGIAAGGSTGQMLVKNSGTNYDTGWTTPVPAASPAFTGTATFAAATLSGALGLTGLTETYTAPAITTGVLTINLTLGTVFNVSVGANITSVVISNATAAKSQSFTLAMKGNGTAYTQAWGSIKWAGASAPTLTSTLNKVDLLTFFTNDGGTTWFALIAGQNF